ncbi:MAG: hypothetical protein K2F63_03885, partial [Muribaculaceae bacterium]|nr:hypothetical protein [Muribaculaceae bacterium]
FTPSPGMTLDFGQVAVGSKTTSRVFVSGANMTGNVGVTVYSGDAAMFSAPADAISASQVCSADGYWLTVTYAPTSVGTHESRILFSGAFGSRGVALKGQCYEVPVLTACTATAPTGIEPDRYTANWISPEGEVVDYYVVTRTRYVGAQAFTEEIEAEGTSQEITGFDESDSEAYSVQSVRLGYRSPMSNVVFVDHSGISGVKVDEPLVVQSFPGIIRFICSGTQTGCRVYDTFGRLVASLDSISQNDEVEVPLGVYLVVTDQHSTPVKVLVRN